MTIKEKIVEKYNKIDGKFNIRRFKLHYFAVALILFAIPLTVILAQNQTNSSTRAQSKSANVLASEDNFIIPASDGENDQEAYVAPADIKEAQATSNIDVLADDKALTTEPIKAASTTKPNIVFLLLDDAAYIDDRIWNRLPTIKSLFIDQGARFTNFQGETPLCCPGRAGFLTGQHTFNHKMINNDASLLNPNVTIATELHKSGYYTFLAGKYFNGFDARKNKTPGWDNFSGYGGAYSSFWLWNNGKHVFYPTQYSTNVIAGKTLSYLRKAPANKPIFAYVAPFAVHGTANTFPHSQPDKKYIGDPRCKNIPKWNPANYNEADMSDKPKYNRNRGMMSPGGWDLKSECETLLSVEDLVRRMKTELANQGRLKNTVFVLGVDNGMNWGAHRYYGKVWPYATQVNFFIHWPDGIGTDPFTISETVQNIDVAPTFCEIGGCKMGPYPNGQTEADGISFLSLLKRKTTTLGRDAILEDLIKPGIGAGGMPIYYSLMTTPQNALGRWHYIEYEGGEKELYDISNGPCITWVAGNIGDPCELNNLLASNITPSAFSLQNASALSARLKQLKVEKGYKPVPPPSAIPTPTPTRIPTPTPTTAPSPIVTP